MSRSHRYEQFGPEIVAPLNDELDDLYRRIDALEANRFRAITVPVTTAVSEVRHGLNKKPECVAVTMGSDARVWITRITEFSVFLQASASVVVTIYVK